MLNKIVNSKFFQNTILFFILLNAVLVGLETSPKIVKAFGNVIDFLSSFCLAVFVLELILRIASQRLQFFKDGWSIFDLLIVCGVFVFDNGVFSTFRVFRVIRVLRLISVIPKVRLILQTLINSLMPMFSIGVLLLIFFYIYAVITTNLYGEKFPQWFGDLGESFYTLFQIMTFESWSMGIVRPVMEIYPTAWIVFVSFVLIAGYMVLNIAIGIIVDCISELKESEKSEQKNDLTNQIQNLQKEIQELKDLLKK